MNTKYQDFNKDRLSSTDFSFCLRLKYSSAQHCEIVTIPYCFTFTVLFNVHNDPYD